MLFIRKKILQENYNIFLGKMQHTIALNWQSEKNTKEIENNMKEYK
jgi:hypothetical protein